MLLQLSGGSAFVWISLLCGIGAGTAGRMCDAFSTAGTIVQLGSSFVLYCVFDDKVQCAKTMYLDKESVQPTTYNTTTIFFEIKHIRANITFACKCQCCLEPCGLDLIAGYPPDVPQNLTCSQEGINENITCTWKTGREAYIDTCSYVLVNTNALNGTVSLSPRYSMKGMASATLPTFGSHSQYTVWVTASNKLGKVTSEHLHFILRDVVKPPAPEITQVYCFSFFCVIHWKVKETQLLQVRSTAGHETRITDSITVNTSGILNVSDLHPFMFYEFQTRCKLDLKRGVWSEWSKAVAGRTGEAVPSKELDVWYTEEPPHSQEKFYKILWKELSFYEARGAVREYKVTVLEQLTGKSTESITNGLSTGPIRCSHCNITVSAYNSKGHSPAARIVLPLVTAGPSPQHVVCQLKQQLGLVISWKKPNTTRSLLGYLVEWFPVGTERQDLSWRRMASGNLQTVVTDVPSHRCYTGAVYALYAHGVGKENFQNVCSWSSAPVQGPDPRLKIWDNATVTAHWGDVRREDGDTCITAYKIYYKNQGSHASEKQFGPVPSSVMEYTTDVLLPGQYEIWMTAWVNTAEGPAGPTNRFVINPQIKEENLDTVLTVVAGLFVGIIVLLLCLWQIPGVRQRLTVCFRTIHSATPDPANSKWAKECVVKGQLLPDYKFMVCAVPDTEEPSTVEIQEDPEAPVTNGSPGANSTNNQSPSEAQYLNQDWLTQPDVDSSAPICLDPDPYTHPNVDYISSNGLQNADSEEEAEEDFLNDFFPCPQNPFMEPLVICGGQLTLDDLKINGKVFTDLMQM